MIKNDDFRVCDKCDHFRVHPSGVEEHCYLAIHEPLRFSITYAEERISGDKQTCKGYAKIKTYCRECYKELLAESEQ